VNIVNYKLALLFTRDTLSFLQMQSHTCTALYWSSLFMLLWHLQ